MNRRAFLQELTRQGCLLVRHGARHDVYENPATGRRVAVPRHSEIKNSLCALIRKQLGLS